MTTAKRQRERYKYLQLLKLALIRAGYRDVQQGVLMKYMASLTLVLASVLALLGAGAQAATPAELLADYSTQAASPAQAARGQQFFTAKHGKEWSCASCHTATPTVDRQHASTGKLISPLAPAFNPQRFTDAAKSEKWFRRNCNDVLGRECSAGEKADVLAWLLTFKR
jgi:mono/diheme cytochrome c family protein